MMIPTTGFSTYFSTCISVENMLIFLNFTLAHEISQFGLMTDTVKLVLDWISVLYHSLII